MPVRLPVLAAALALAAPAAAQPAAEAVLRDWLLGTREAAAEAVGVRVMLDSERRVEGPVETRTLRAAIAAEVSEDGLDTDIVEARIDGRRARPFRYAALERRLREAYGGAYAWIERPNLIVRSFLSNARARSRAVPDRVNGAPAWRIALTPPETDHPSLEVTAWFARGERPTRLLRLALSARLANGTASATTDYVRVGGLDLPGERRAEAAIRQRRRLRTYTVLLSSQTRFRDHSVTRR